MGDPKDRSLTTDGIVRAQSRGTCCWSAARDLASGKFDFNDYLIESVLVGTIEEVDADDDYDDD